MSRVAGRVEGVVTVAVAVLLMGLFWGSIAGCSLRFAGEDDALPLVGEAISATHYLKLNRDTVGSYDVLKDAASAEWAVLVERMDAPGTETTPSHENLHVRILRLDAEAPEESIDANSVILGEHHLYLIKFDELLGQPTQLRVVEPGHAAGGVTLLVPPGSGTLQAGPNDSVFLFESIESSTDFQEALLRSDGSFSRILPPRRKAEASEPLRGSPESRFDATGNWLIRQERNGQVILYSTHDENEIDLGIQDWFSGSDEEDEVIYTCGDSGLKRVPLDKSPPVVLDGDPCWVVYLQNFGSKVTGALKKDRVLYKGPKGYAVVPKRGGNSTPLLVPPEGFLLSLGPQNQGAYTTDNSDTYSNEQGFSIIDGWVGDWRFMNRGRDVSWSQSGARLYWLENAARSDNTGDLYDADAIDAAHPTQLLARNVYRYDTLVDGRVIAVSNAANFTPHSRIIVIDEDAQRARRVVEDGRGYLTISNGTELLVEVWAGGDRIDLYRVPLPSR